MLEQYRHLYRDMQQDHRIEVDRRDQDHRQQTNERDDLLRTFRNAYDQYTARIEEIAVEFRNRIRQQREA